MLNHINDSNRPLAALALSAWLATLPIATPAAELPDLGTGPRVAVRYGDLNLSSAEGARVLLRRIEAAARKVCDDPGDARQLARWTAFRSCYVGAVARGVQDVGTRTLVDVYRARYPLASVYPMRAIDR